MRLNPEARVQIQVARFLVNNYPEVQFHSDYGSGVKLSKAQAAIQSKQNGSRRGWPDMFIAKKATATVRGKRGGLKQMFYGGLFIELKADGVRLKKKTGEWSDEHIAEQAEVLEKLRKAGYCAEFAVGYEEAVRIISEYLGEPKPEKVEF